MIIDLYQEWLSDVIFMWTWPIQLMQIWHNAGEMGLR